MKKGNHVRESEASETVQAVEENKVTERKGKNYVIHPQRYRSLFYS